MRDVEGGEGEPVWRGKGGDGGGAVEDRGVNRARGSGEGEERWVAEVGNVGDGVERWNGEIVGVGSVDD